MGEVPEITSDNDDMIDKKRVIELDVQKLHAEVNQLRQQEFLTTSFALALVASVLPTLITRDQSPKIAVAVLAMLLTLWLWNYTIARVRLRIVSYLRYCKYSNWENDYRCFTQKIRNPSQSMVATIFFLILGLFVTGAALLEKFSVPGFMQSRSVVALAGAIVIYVLIVAVPWFVSSSNQWIIYRETWRYVLGSRSNQSGDLVTEKKDLDRIGEERSVRCTSMDCLD
jgi:hypothetical protein